MPQAPTFNRQSWRLLEEYCRSLVAQGNELYIVAGPSGKGGEGDTGTAMSLAGGKLTVPAALWKVIVVLPIGSNDLSRITAQTRVIAVWMPNTNPTGDAKWSDFRTSIDEIEAKTGLDLLANVPASVQQVLEAGVDKTTIQSVYLSTKLLICELVCNETHFFFPKERLHQHRVFSQPFDLLKNRGCQLFQITKDLIL